MKYNLIFFVLMISLFITTSCGRITNEEIKNLQWKYGEGYHIGDVLLFDDHKLIGDTIYKDDKSIAVITKSGGMFWESPDLIIKAITSEKTGTYHDMGKRK